MSADFIRWTCRVCGIVSAAVAGSVHAGVVTDGTVGPRVQLDGDFEIGADLGRRAGRNLFHSFERFSLDAGERATFSGPTTSATARRTSICPAAWWCWTAPCWMPHRNCASAARCGAIGASSFTGVGRGGLPPSPDGPLAGAYASGFGSPGVALVPEERGGAVSAEEHPEDRAIWPAVVGLAPCHGAL